MKTKKQTTTKKEIKNISLSLVCGDKKYKAEADTFQEALESIYKDSLGFIKTWGVFTLKVGGKKSEFRYRPIQIKRAFLMRFGRELLEKRLNLMLK